MKAAKSIPIFAGRRWPVGLHNAARRLGCDVSHLQRVLDGQRTSRRVSEGYAALVTELRTKGGLN